MTTMSMHFGIDHLDFQVDELNAVGQQEYVDAWSLAPGGGGRVVETTTVHQDPLHATVILGRQPSQGAQLGIAFAEGLRIILASPNLGDISVVDINSMPRGHSLGVATMARLFRTEGRLELAGFRERTFTKYEGIRLPLLPGGFLKVCLDIEGKRTDEESAVVKLLSDRQSLEYGLVREVHVAIGRVTRS